MTAFPRTESLGPSGSPAVHPSLSPAQDQPLAPGLSAAPHPSDAARWATLLDRLDPDRLTDTFLALIGQVPGYSPSPLPHAEVVRSARRTFVSLVAGLRDGGLDDDTAIAHHVGVSRARAGIPLTSLMTAIRHDFSVLWEELIAVSEEADAELIVRHTGIVLRTVDQYVGQTQRAYVAERTRMDEEASSVRQGLIAALFQSPGPAGERVGRIAEQLGIPVAARYSVAVARGEEIAALRVFVSESERAGATVHTHHSGDSLAAFTHAAAPAGSRLAEIRAQLLTQRVGVAEAAALADVARAAATAGSLAALLGPEEHGAMTWTRGWARLAGRHLLDAGTPAIADVHAALAGCGPAERARLEEAARSYLVTGSIGESAAQLFCHRNTLANRLRRFAELTGVDPLVPEQAARLVVGWAAPPPSA